MPDKTSTANYLVMPIMAGGMAAGATIALQPSMLSASIRIPFTENMSVPVPVFMFAANALANYIGESIGKLIIDNVFNASDVSKYEAIMLPLGAGLASAAITTFLVNGLDIKLFIFNAVLGAMSSASAAYVSHNFFDSVDAPPPAE